MPESLPSIQLGGRAPAVDPGLLAQLAREPGPAAMAMLVQAALANRRLAISSDIPCEQLVAGLFNLLPVECRVEFSFTTGLNTRQADRCAIWRCPADAAAARAAARQGFTVLQLDPTAGSDVTWDGWAGWIASNLTSGKLSALAAELEKPRPGLTTAGLDELAASIQADASADSAGPYRNDPPPRTSTGANASGPPKPDHGLTRRMRHRPACSWTLRPNAGPSWTCWRQSWPNSRLHVLEMLERVDDLVFAAISGDAQALAELEVAWPLAASELEPELVEQSREQYLRRALAICADFAEGEVRRPERALAAIDVLSVLFEE